MPDTARFDPDHCPLSRQMQFLLQTIQQLSMVRSLDEVQHLVAHAARELTGCDGATFVLREKTQCYYAEEHSISPLWKGQRFPLEACISGWCMQNGMAVNIPDVFADPRVPHTTYRDTFVKSMVMVPIRTLDPVGAIGNYWAAPHHASAEEVHLLQTLADSVSVVLENVRVYHELEDRVRERTEELESALQQIQHLSITDDLTGLYNRRGFRLLAGQTLCRLQRSREPFLLAYLDVDGLKKTNDQHGHGVGDTLLMDMATVLRDTFRASDIVARLGGDEFCVLAVGTGDDQHQVRQRFEAALERFNLSIQRPYRLACSLGIVPGEHNGRTQTIDEMIAEADKWMYREKTARRGVKMVAGRG